jgi:polysaccharide pyruvyl transferase WcaK-like protein
VSSATAIHWPPGDGPRLLIADGWSLNAGDAAIASATAASLRRVLPRARTLWCESHPGLVLRHYPGLPIVPSLETLVRDQPQLVASADAVISRGGGFLFEHYSAHRRIGAHLRALELGTPLAIWAQSIGRFEDPGNRAALRRALEGARVVVTRDRESADNLAAMEIRPRRLTVTADEALMLPLGRAARPGPIVGLTLNGTAHVPGGGGTQARPSELPRRHAALVEALLARAQGANAPSIAVRALSTAQGSGTPEVEDDLPHHRAIRELLPPGAAERMEVLGGFVPLPRMAASLDGLDVLVSCRMHAALIAMVHGVPAVYASANFKGVSLFERLGLEELVVPDDDPDAVVAAVERASALRSGLPRRIRGLRSEARQTAALVVERLGLR